MGSTSGDSWVMFRVVSTVVACSPDSLAQPATAAVPPTPSAWTTRRRVVAGMVEIAFPLRVNILSRCPYVYYTPPKVWECYILLPHSLGIYMPRQIAGTTLLRVERLVGILIPN